MTNSQLWFRGVRSSKFRHVYGEPSKREKCYDNIKVTKNAHDSQFCAVNPKFLAVVTEVAGGGAFIVLPIDHTGRLDFNAYRVTGHRGPVLDIKWNPFNDNVIASCSDDCTIKLWNIPDGGLSMHLTEWLAELQGHKRRVAYIEWHPTAENILFSAGFDHLVIVWHIGRAEAINVIDCHTDVIYSMSLNRDGSLLATTSKDKKLRVIEPRSGIVKSEGVCHQGSKASKVAFLGATEKLLTTGFSRHSDRQYAVWNQHDLSHPLAIDTIDSSSGVVFPFFDPDTNIIYLAGKGDGNIRYYEIVNEAPWIHFLNQFLSGNPQRGLGFMPKRGCNVNQCEIFRFFKLHATRGMCEPIGMIVPRKSDQFHDDLYPDTAAPVPALTADEWISGRNVNPILMSLKTGVSISTYKPNIYKPQVQTMNSIDNNNKKKFAFLSTETIPDYRPKDMLPHNEKIQKTTNNQTTKFHQLQQMFGNMTKEEPNNDVIPYKQINNADNDIFYEFANEEELRRAYKRQIQEIRHLQLQISIRDRRIDDLEGQLRKLLHNGLIRRIFNQMEDDKQTNGLVEDEDSTYNENGEVFKRHNIDISTDNKQLDDDNDTTIIEQNEISRLTVKEKIKLKNKKIDDNEYVSKTTIESTMIDKNPSVGFIKKEMFSNVKSGRQNGIVDKKLESCSENKKLNRHNENIKSEKWNENVNKYERRYEKSGKLNENTSNSERQNSDSSEKLFENIEKPASNEKYIDDEKESFGIKNIELFESKFNSNYRNKKIFKSAKDLSNNEVSKKTFRRSYPLTYYV